MLDIRKKLYTFLPLFILLTLPIFSFAQSGKFDVRMLIDSLDCTNDKLFITLQVRADNPGEEFYLGDQNYRFSFNTNVLSNPTIVQELDASAYISGGPGPAGFSFYSPHSMTGSLDTIVSYNLELQGGDGLYITDTDYVNVGVVSLDILDYNTPVCLRWHRDIPADFPNTYIGQNYVGALIPTIEGSYLDYYQDLSNACMNGSPVAVNDTGTTPEDQAITICLSTNDSDPENTLDASSVSLLSSPPASEGTATLDVITGCITFTPTADFNGTVTAFDYQICDMGMQIPSYHGDNNPNPIPAPDTGDPDLQTMPPACITATVNITVTPANDAPVATDDAGSTPEDTPLNGDVSINDSDLDGDPLTATPVTQPTNGTLTLNANGTYTYTPDTDYNGADSFEYQICDNGSPALCDNAVVNITVTPANDAPVATDDAGSTPEDTPLNGDVSINDSDLDGDPLTATPVTQPTNGTLTLNANGTYTYTPDTDYNGADSFEYQICDNGSPALCDNAVVNITVTPANDAPVATDDAGSTPEDTPLNGDVSTNDSDLDGDPLTVNTTPVTSPANGNVTLNANGTYTYVPNLNFFGSDSFEYQICDNGSPALCDNAIVNITVTSVNDAPVVTNDQATTNEATPVDIDVLLNDSDTEDGTLDPCSVTIATAPTNGTVTFSLAPACVLTYTPNSGFSGNDTFEYQVCDSGGTCENAIVDVTVNQVCLNIDLKVWLEGGLSDLAGGYLPSMRADLSRVRYILPGQSNSTLPSGQPYNTTPWNYMGTEGPGWTDADYQNIEAANAGMGVVDWILVSFRTGLATSTTFQKAAALVFEDGSIVFADPCVLTVSAPSSIYIVIEHRNHMGVMSHIPATVSGGQISYDFRNQDSYTNVSFGQKQVAPGMYAMYAGDCDQISDVTSYDTNGNDKALWIAENGIFAQYLLTDLNLNGDITGADKILWFQNNGIASGVLR
mgnify:CR=1 FL=1